MSNYKANIWKYYLFTIFGSLELTVAIFVLFFLDNSLSMTEVMILQSIYTLLLIFLEVPSGAFADRVGRKKSLVLSALLISIAWIIFGVGTTFWIFLIAMILWAFSDAFESGADDALLFDSLKETKNEKAYAKISGRIDALNTIILASLGLISGFLATFFSYRLLFFFSAFFYLITFLISLTFKEPPIYKHLQEKNYISHLKKAVKFTWEHKVVRNMIILFGIASAFTTLIYYLIQPYYEVSGLPNYVIGIAISSFFLFLSLGNIFADKIIKFWSDRKIIIITLLVISIAFLGIGFLNPLFAIGFIAIISFLGGIRNIFINKKINENTDSHHRATVGSVKSISKSIIYSIFAPLVGLFTDIYTPMAAFTLLGISMFAFLIYFIILAKLYKKSPAL